MSKIVYLCFKDPGSSCFSREDIEVVIKRIGPDNISARAADIMESEGIIYGIANPSETIQKRGQSVLMGQAFGQAADWWKPGTQAPEGTYAIFRADESSVELLTDVVASRTIWYFMDEEVFMASTSQRALVMLMKNFQFNPDVIPWMMSTGSLGPSNSWDSRIKMVPPDSIVSLNRTNWQLETRSQPVMFSEEKTSNEDHQNRLTKSLTDTFQSLKVDFDKWVIPLSGGFDSRSILCFFNAIGQDLSNLRAITWGLKELVNKKGNDAFVAKKVADHFKIQHTYYSTDLTDEPLEKILNRFLVCGEGRIDHVSGYMDGFNIWKTLYENQVKGIIRGDECFGWVWVDSEVQLRSCLGIALCSDFSNLENYKQYGMNAQKIPDQLQQREKESLAQWRDRLYQQFRIPVILSALNDLKLSYVEVINPLLSKNIIYCTRSLPDKLRQDKFLFKKIVKNISPQIEYASSSAIARLDNVFKSEKAVVLLKAELSSPEAKSLFQPEFLHYILTNLKADDSIHPGKRKPGLISLLKLYLPQSVKYRLIAMRNKSKLDFNKLAFRIYMVVKMHRILVEDASLEALSELDNSRRKDIS
jgi:hypothetical protein